MATASLLAQPRQTNLPTPPSGWPIGSYETYAEAQRAVDHLADNNFPVGDVTIVGIEPMLVERVTGRLTWGRVLAAGAASGAWFGFFVGLLLGMFSTAPGLGAILTGVITGVVFGMGFAAFGYASLKGQRGSSNPPTVPRSLFVSNTQFVAGRYDVLSLPRNAEKGRELLGRLATM